MKPTSLPENIVLLPFLPEGVAKLPSPAGRGDINIAETDVVGAAASAAVSAPKGGTPTPVFFSQVK
jgi:hypothetical protein